MAVTVWLTTTLAILAGVAARSVPVVQPAQLPPVPGYIPVYIQSGDTPPDVQRLYQSHRTLAHAAHAPAVAPSRRQDVADGGARLRPQQSEARDAPRSRGPTSAPVAPTTPAVPALVPNNSRVIKKGGAGLAAPEVGGGSHSAASAAAGQQQDKKGAAKKRAGTRVQYQQQQKAAQTRKRQQQQRSAKQQQQQRPLL